MEGTFPQQPTGMPPQVYMGRPPVGGYLSTIIIGIIILLIGGMIAVGAGFLDDPQQPDSDDYEDWEDYEEALRDYRDEEEEFQDNTRLIQTIGNTVQYIGLILFSVGMLLGALTDRGLAPNIRLGMLVALGIIIGFKIGGSVFYYWF